MEEEKDQPAPANNTEVDSKDYSNDPFFIKKRERAKEFIDKHGIPENFLKTSK